MRLTKRLSFILFFLLGLIVLIVTANYIIQNFQIVSFRNDSRVLSSYTLDTKLLLRILNENHFFQEGMIPWEERQRVFPKKIRVQLDDNISEGQQFKDSQNRVISSIKDNYDARSKTFTIAIAYTASYAEQLREYGIVENNLTYTILHFIYIQQKNKETYSYDQYMNLYRIDGPKYARRIMKKNGNFFQITNKKNCGILNPICSLFSRSIGEVHADCSGQAYCGIFSAWSCTCSTGGSCTIEGSSCGPGGLGTCGSCTAVCGGGTSIIYCGPAFHDQSSCEGASCSGACAYTQTGGCSWTDPPTPTPTCAPSCTGLQCGQANGCGGYCPNTDNVTTYGSWDGGTWCGDGTDSRSASNPCSSPSSWTDYGSSWCVECGTCPSDNPPLCGGYKGDIDCSSCGYEPDLRDGTWNLPADGASFLHDDTITISGVAKDTNDATVGVERIDVYRDGPPGSGVGVGSIAVDPATGNFSGTFPANFYSNPAGSDHTLELWAIKKDPLDCDNWKIGSTRTIHITNNAPTTGNFSILDGSGAVACTDATCNNGDFITTYDTNYNQKVRVKATFTDLNIPEAGSNKVTDLRYAWIIFDNDTDSGNGTFYRIKFSNNADGTINASDVQSSDSGTTYDGVITVESLDASFDSGTHTLTVYATMNLTGISKNGATGPFLTNIYLKTEDYASAITSRDLKSSTLDIWNGKDIPVQASRIRDGDTAKSGDWNAQFVSSCNYTVDAVDKTTQTIGIPSGGTLSSVFYLPYVNYGGANNCTITMQSADTGFYINGSDFTQFSGVSNTRSSGQYTVSNHLDQGGASHSGKTITLSYVENAPTVTAGSNTVLNSSGGTACNGTSCNNKDLIVDLDDNNNKKVTFQTVFTDLDNNVAAATGNALSDIASAYIYFDTDNNGANGDIYRIQYTDSADGTNYTLVSENYLSNTSHYGVIAISNASATVLGNTLTVQFTLDLSGIAKEGATGPVVSNIYLAATDWAGTTTGRVLSASSLDIWNGKDVKTYSSFYEVNPNSVCGSYISTLSSLIPLFDVLYKSGGGPYTYGGNGASVTGESLDMTSAKFLPYYYFTTSDIVSSTFGINTTGQYALSWIDASAYGGGCDKSTGGTISSVSMKNGGAVIAGGAVNNGLTQTFKVGLSQISNVWLQIVNGTFYTHTNFAMDVPASTYTDAYLNYSSNQNGITIVNGALSGTVSSSNIGFPVNWYAKEVSSIKPVTAPSITNLNGYQGYIDVKQQFGTVATIATTDSIISADPTGTIFMYDQNLSITSNISVPVDSYKVFIVHGNLTIDAGVDTLEGIYIVYGNLTIEDDGTPNYDRQVTTGAITLNGSLMVQGTLTIDRTLGAANDNAVPFTITYDPQYMHAMTQDVALTSFWQPYKHRMGE